MPKAYVIGSGVAGLCAAIAAKKVGYQVTIFDHAPEVFYHTSGRNAAIGRSYEADYFLAVPQRNTIAFLLDYPQIFKPCGLLIRPLEKDYWQEFPNESFIPKELTFSFPDGTSFSGEFIAANGVIELKNLARYFLNLIELEKVALSYHTEVKKLTVEQNHISQIEIFYKEEKKTGKFFLNEGDIVINAAGAWAKRVGELAGTLLAIIPHKRHLYYLAPPVGKKIPENLPVIWDEYYDFYIRPAQDYILATPADQIPVEPGDYSINPDMQNKMRQILEEHLPYFADFQFVSAHTCLRSFTRDHRPIIGYDPNITNFFWNAGWGGHGISLSIGIIPIIETLIRQGPRKESELENPFTLSRFF